MKIVTVTIGAMGLAMAASASAATLTSTPFSVGYGFTSANAGTWNTVETTSANTIPSGDFNVAVTLAGTKATTAGPSFLNRVIGDGSLSSYYGGAIPSFAATITGSYTGPAPADAAADPNYQVEVNITGISIYGYEFDPDLKMNFNETTAGNTQSQTPQGFNAVPSGANVNSGSAYTQFVWNPAEFLSPIDQTSQTRTFNLSAQTAAGAPATRINLDGFEVFGNVVVHYDAVPEPASLGLVALGGCLLIRRRRK